jgi:hypothetical protein
VTLSSSAFLTRRPRDAPSATRTAVCCRFLQPARQQQIGDVGAGHQQHATGRDHQQQQTLAVIPPQTGETCAARRQARASASATQLFPADSYPPRGWPASHAIRSAVALQALRIRSGRTRPIKSSQSTRGFLIRAVVPNINGSVDSGNQISGTPQLVIFAPMKPAGATPMIVNARPLIWYVDPTTEGSEPYFSCQAWKLITATGGAPSRSSASMNSLPRHADTPRSEKSFRKHTRHSPSPAVPLSRRVALPAAGYPPGALPDPGILSCLRGIACMPPTETDSNCPARRRCPGCIQPIRSNGARKPMRQS